MTEVILGQLRFILWMMCGGMAILAGYDVLRLFRWLVPHGAVWIAVEDLFFWGAASVPAFILFLKMHDGQIRWYGVVALLSGIVLTVYCFYFTGNHVLFLILPYGCSNTTVASSDNFGYRVLSSYFLRFCG